MALRLLVIVALAFITTPAATVSATEPTADADIRLIQERVHAALEDLRAKAAFPAVGVGFVLADGRSGGVACGMADVENNVLLTISDRLLAGSVGKMFVAAITLQLAEEGKLSLDDLAAKWIGNEPWFGRLPNASELTVRSLLNHTAGLQEYYDQPGVAEAIKADPDRQWTPEDRLKYVFESKPLFAVGKGWSYADTNYVLVGLIAERAGGKPLFELIDGGLLKPLTLNGIIPSNSREVDRLVAGYAGPKNPLGFDGRTVTNGKLMTNPQIEWAGGGLATTPEDLARSAKLLFEGKAFQKRETLEMMLSGVDMPSRKDATKRSQYGLGVMIHDSQWGPSYGHGGWFPGYRTEVAYFPERKVAIAVQFNTDIGPSLKKGVPAYLIDVARIVFEPAK